MEALEQRVRALVDTMAMRCAQGQADAEVVDYGAASLGRLGADPHELAAIVGAVTRSL